MSRLNWTPTAIRLQNDVNSSQKQPSESEREQKICEERARATTNFDNPPCDSYSRSPSMFGLEYLEVGYLKQFISIFSHFWCKVYPFQAIEVSGSVSGMGLWRLENPKSAVATIKWQQHRRKKIISPTTTTTIIPTLEVWCALEVYLLCFKSRHWPRKLRPHQPHFKWSCDVPLKKQIFFSPNLILFLFIFVEKNATVKETSPLKVAVIVSWRKKAPAGYRGRQSNLRQVSGFFFGFFLLFLVWIAISKFTQSAKNTKKPSPIQSIAPLVCLLFCMWVCWLRVTWKIKMQMKLRVFRPDVCSTSGVYWGDSKSFCGFVGL